MGFILLIIDGHDMTVHHCLEVNSVCVYVYVSLASHFYANFFA